MRYFKIIINGNVVGAGCNFLRWFPRTGELAYCEMEQAECVKDVVSESLYHDGWLRAVPAGKSVSEATVALIGQEEYDELVEQLIDGETIPEPEPEPEPTPEPTPEPEPEPERRMTIQEMREAIAELTSMTAKENIEKGSYFVLHDAIYQAVFPIVKGTEIIPGRNCIQKSLQDIME